MLEMANNLRYRSHFLVRFDDEEDVPRYSS